MRQNAIVAAFQAGSRDQGLLFLDARMASRRTYPQWGTTLMGPICDKLGWSKELLTLTDFTGFATTPNY